jgi:ligand-binding sensor domain-containing protein
MLHKTGDGSFAFILQKGGFGMLPSSFTRDKARNINLTVHLKDESINAIKTDKDGNLWTGTKNGLFKSAVIFKNVQSLYIPQVNYKKEEKTGLRSIFFQDTNMWISSNASGFFTTTRELNDSRNIAFKGGSLLNMTWSNMSPNGADTLWLNTQNGIRWYNTRTRSSGKLLNARNYSLFVTVTK